MYGEPWVAECWMADWGKDISGGGGMKKKHHKNKIVCIFQFVNSPYAWNLKEQEWHVFA